jgi:hypothetical protein
LIRENNYTYREADESDFEALADFLSRHGYAPKHLQCSRQDYQRWLTWKFLENPDGPALIFIAEDSRNMIVGLRAYMPRLCKCPRRGSFMAYHGVDALTDANSRKEGIYSNLRRFGLTKLKYPRFSFPTRVTFNRRSRDGDRTIGSTKRWLFPVTIAQSITKKPYGTVVPLANLFLELYASSWLGKLPADLEIRSISKFDGNFEYKSDVIHCIRSAEYLNWRFIDNPWHSYEAYEFHEGNERIGYCVYAVARSKAEIYDFTVRRRQRNCLRLLVERCREQGIINMRFRGVGLHLEKFGFICSRDPQIECNASSDLPQGAWMMTLGDRDY